MRQWRGRLLPLLLPSLRKDGCRHLGLSHPVLLSIALLCIVQGCCESSDDDTLGSVYGSLVAGNGGGGGGNGDDWGPLGVPPDAEYITAIIGESVVFNCHVEFPDNYPVPYIVQWDKKGVEIPIHIWYDGYPTHSGEGYEGRVARVNPNSSFGLASLNLTSIRESDRGWYNCRVYFLNRSPPPQNNRNVSGSWYHLDVHAPPRFVHTSDDVVYTKIGKNIILHCRAEGTPTPEIVWYKDTDPVQPSVTVSIVNEGTELRISNIKNEDIGDYTCIARNGEGKIHHSVKVLIAGSAVIINPPQNTTKAETEKVVFPCEWRAMPANATVVWYRDGIPVRQIASLESRIETPAEGSLIINPLHMDDSGFYECRVSNGIGETQSAVAYLNVEFPAQVTYTPTVQYLPNRLSGVVRCYIQANPGIQFVMWTRDKHLLEPYETEGFAVMHNGSLLIERVKESHQGMYTCTPYNVHGTKGASLAMQVIVKDPPKFEITPDPMYQSKLSTSLEIPCTAVAPNGTTSPLITWQRKDGRPLPRDRARVVDGTLFLEDLHQMDYGDYLCLASNEVATLVTSTKIIVEGTRPHAPYNITATAAMFYVTLNWYPGYSGGPDFRQSYVVWYRKLGESRWETIHVTPPGSQRITIRNLSPGTTYQFQIVGTNELGEGHPSEIINVTTKGVDTILANGTSEPPKVVANATTKPEDPSTGTIIGPKPGVPYNVTIVDQSDAFSIGIHWMPPIDADRVAVAYYQIQYKSESEAWKTLNKEKILPPQTSYTYLVRHLKENKKYIFRVVAFTLTGSSASSEEVLHTLLPRDKQRAIVAGLVGGILFFIVAIILSVCAVKICNRRKRRKQEKGQEHFKKRSGAARVRDAISLVWNPAKAISSLKRAYQWVGRVVGICIIRLLDLPLRRRAIIISRERGSRPPSITSITLSLVDTGPHRVTRHLPSSPSTFRPGQPRGIVLPWGKGSIVLPDVVDESSSDDGGFLAPRPLRYFPRGRRRFNLVLPGSFVPSSSLIRPETIVVPRPFASSPIPARSRSMASGIQKQFSPSSADLSSVPRFPVLVQVHQPPYLWKTATTGRHFHPRLPSDPTPPPWVSSPTEPPWEAERIRDNLARDLEYLERQVPPFLRHQLPSAPHHQQSSVGGGTVPLEKTGLSSSISARVQQERSSSSGFQSGSKIASSTFPSGAGSSGVGTGLGSGGTTASEVFLRPIAFSAREEERLRMEGIFAGESFPPSIPSRSFLPPRTYENWPRRDSTPPIYAMARSPSFDIDETQLTVPLSEASPGTRTLLDASVDDPYEFDAVIPDTSPEIAYPSQPPPSSTVTPSTSMTRFKRTREKYENMEARVAAMKEEFFEYRRRQKKRMESAC